MEILYEDDALLVLNKPAGLLAVPGRGIDKQDCLATRVQSHYPDARVVHRLDMATSGIMLMARGTRVQRILNEQFMRRLVRKQYVAQVHGRFNESSGVIDLPVSADWPNRPRQQVAIGGGKPALTFYRVLGDNTANNTSRLLLQPHTGRTHQLRVHLLAIGHAIVGDTLYVAQQGAYSAARLMLHAQGIALQHPLFEQPCNFTCETPF